MIRNARLRLERLEANWKKQLSQKILRLFPEWLETELRQHEWASSMTSRDTAVDWQYEALPAQRVFH